MDPRFAPILSLIFCFASSVLSARVDITEANELSASQLFVFGASMVDSGTNAVAMPYRSDAEFHPYGSDYFERPTGRWSNGRTFMDLITESLGFGFLDPFIKSIGSNFTHGVNFASSGSTAQNTSSTTTDSGGLFSLLVQVDQFQEYQNDVVSKQQDWRVKSKLRQNFSNSIFFFETAHNDYLKAGLESNQSEVVNVVIAYMRQAFESLYSLGARNFIIMNVTPLGCVPSRLTATQSMEKDAYNCTIAWNDFVEMHNEKLEELLSELRSEYPSAQWILFDAFNIFLDGYRNPSNYGIQYPLQACCGAGGPYNYNPDVTCGEGAKYINGTYIKAEKCKDPSLHLIWDSLHPVESFSKYVARGVLDGTYLSPYFDITMKLQNIDAGDKSIFEVN